MRRAHTLLDRCVFIFFAKFYAIDKIGALEKHPERRTCAHLVMFRNTVEVHEMSALGHEILGIWQCLTQCQCITYFTPCTVLKLDLGVARLFRTMGSMRRSWT